MKTKEERLKEFKEFGERLLQQRPKPYYSVADDLKRMYFAEKRMCFGEAIHYLGPTDGIVITQGQRQFWLIFFACINDDERFWYSMYLLQRATPLYESCSITIHHFEVLENFVIEHAKDYGMEHEVAKLLLSIKDTPDEEGTLNHRVYL